MRQPGKCTAQAVACAATVAVLSGLLAQTASSKMPPAMADINSGSDINNSSLTNLFKVRVTTADKMKAMSDLSILNTAISRIHISNESPAAAPGATARPGAAKKQSSDPEAVRAKRLAQLLNLRGTCLALIGERTKAISDLDEAVKSDSSFAPAFNNRAWMRAQAGELQAALTDVNTALTLEPKMAEAYDTRGTINFALQHFDLAMEDFDSSIAHRNDYAEAYYHRAMLHKKLGHDEEYSADEKKAIELKYPVE